MLVVVELFFVCRFTRLPVISLSKSTHGQVPSSLQLFLALLLLVLLLAQQFLLLAQGQFCEHLVRPVSVYLRLFASFLRFTATGTKSAVAVLTSENCVSVTTASPNFRLAIQ